MSQASYAKAFDTYGIYAPDDAAWNYFPATDLPTARSQSMSSCCIPVCDRVHTGIEN